MCIRDSFNTFTLVNNGNGTSMKADVLITMREGYLNMTSNYFNFNNAKKTGRNEMYHDSKKGDMIVSQYLTNYYDIALIRYVEYPEAVSYTHLDVYKRQV